MVARSRVVVDRPRVVVDRPRVVVDRRLSKSSGDWRLLQGNTKAMSFVIQPYFYFPPSAFHRPELCPDVP